MDDVLGQGCKSTSAHGGWELDRGARGAISVQGPTMTAGRQLKGAGERKFMMKSVFGRNPGDHGSRVLLLSHVEEYGRHCSLPLLTRMHWQLSTEKDPGQGSLSSCWPKQWRRTSQEGTLGVSCQRREKNPNRVISPVPVATGFSAHLAPPSLLQSKQLHHLQARSSLEQTQVL